MKTNMSFFMGIVAVSLLLTGASVWEGSAVMTEGKDMPETGYYVATNSFPRNTVVDITNLENGKTVRGIVASGLDALGLLATLSQGAAESLGLESGSIGRIRMTQPADPVAFSRFKEGKATAQTPASGAKEPASAVAASSEQQPGAAPAPASGAKEPASTVAASSEQQPAAAPAPASGAKEPAPAVAASSEQQPAAAPAPASGEKEPAAAVAASNVQQLAAAPAQSSSAKAPVPAANTASGMKEPAGSPPAATETFPYISRSAANVEPVTSNTQEPEWENDTYYTEADYPDVFSPPMTDGNNGLAKEAALSLAGSGTGQAERMPMDEPQIYFPEFDAGQADPASPQDMQTPASMASPEGPVKQYSLVPSEERIPPALSQVLIPPEQIIPPIESSGKVPSGDANTAVPQNPSPIPASAATPANMPPSDFSPFLVPMITSMEKGKYYVQLGAYSRAELVEDEINRIGVKNPLTIQNIGSDEKPLFRILLGPLNLGESGAMLQRFKSIGYKDAFLHRN
ncbi:MAG: hypothetical protein LBD18_06915 [Treponema sp.]|jgi:hypothetical protein|nr:hypothetical protein [Treponema sp.]